MMRNYQLGEPELDQRLEELVRDAVSNHSGHEHDEALVRRITRLVDIAEYKRRQSPPGVRVSPKAFGKDRRMPITSGYRG